MNTPSPLQSFYPVIQTTKVAECRDFYVRHFDFELTFDSDWYVSLRRGRHELAFLAAGHDTAPESGRGAVSGLILNLEVEDANAEHARLVSESGLPVEQQLRDEVFGQRHFILRDPAGVLVDVIQPIPPTPEFAAQYASDALPSE